MKDIAPDLLKAIQDDFKERVKTNAKVRNALKAMKSKNATFEDANSFAEAIGDALAESFKNNIKPELLPDKRMYYNIAERVVGESLKNNYNLVSEYSADVQTLLNKKANLGLKGIKPEYNADKAKGIINRISSEEKYEDISWLLEEPVTNFTQSIVDDTIKTNAEFQYKAGLKAKIIRKSTGHCCDWCEEVAGEYEYPDVPKDVYRRHRFCRCTVEYDPGNGRRQNVHSKKWRDIDENEKLEARKTINKEASTTNELVRSCQEENIDYNPVKKIKNVKTEDEIINRLSGGDQTSGSCSSLAFAYIGNKAGYDVLDFRGGSSCKFFSRDSNIQKIADLKNVKSYVEKHTSDFKAVKNLLSHAEQGKEYYLSTGKHAAIVRKTENGMEFLELQSPGTKGYPPNGFAPLTDKILRKRFGCKNSHSIYGIKLEAQSTLIDIESLYESDEFKDVLGFINTEGKNQMKGANGSVK